jgi:hypothetical protein
MTPVRFPLDQISREHALVNWFAVKIGYHTVLDFLPTRRKGGLPSRLFRT